MKEFYVQVTNTASTEEFPDNTAHTFKNRLPYPLQFKEEGWKVGLTSITYPVPPERSHPTRSPFEKDNLLCRIKWSEKALDIRGNVVATVSTLNIKGSDLTPSSITSGKALMKFIVN